MFVGPNNSAMTVPSEEDRRVPSYSPQQVSAIARLFIFSLTALIPERLNIAGKPASLAERRYVNYSNEEAAIGTRPLTDDELAELSRIATTMRIKPWLIAIPLTLWFWPIVILSVASRRYPSEPFLWFAYALLGTMTVYWERQVIVGTRTARKLLLDRNEGRVEVESAAIREVLPVSRMEWTVDGSPALWRGHAPKDPSTSENN